MGDFAAPDQSDFQSLARRLRGVKDVALRVGGCRAALGELDGVRLDALVAEALTAVVDGLAPAQDVLMALGLAIESGEWDGLRGRAALSALGRGDARVAEYLVPQPEPPPEGVPMAVPDFGKGRPLTLGERKSVARGHDPNLIARVLRDPDPQVVAILLGNPSLVEAHVVRLAARRPVNPAVLREVYRSLRWSTRHDVRLALVQNPWCPLEVGVRLVPLLTAAERRSVGRSGELSAQIRRLCAALTPVAVDPMAN